MRKLLLISAAALGAVLLILAVVVGYAVLNLNSIIKDNRAYILAQAGNALGRPVEIKEITAGIGWSVTMDASGVRIGDDPAFSQRPFVQARLVSGELEFLPLLARKVKITRLVLVEPQVRIIRDAAGRLNVASIGAGPGPARSQPTVQPPQAPLTVGAPSQGGGALGNLSVANLAIRDGQIWYTDAAVGPKPVQIHHVDLELSNFSATAPFQIQLKLALLGDKRNLEASGKLGPLMKAGVIDAGAMPAALKLHLGPLLLDSARTLAMLRHKIPAELSMPDPIGLTATAVGTLDALRLTVNADFTPQRVLYLGVFSKPAAMPFKLAATASRRAGKLGASRVELRLGDLDLEATRITIDDGAVAARLDTNRFDLGLLPKILVALASYSASGQAELHGQAKIGAGKPSLEGTLKLLGAAFNSDAHKIPAISKLNATVRLSPNSAAIEPATLTLGSARLSLQARAESLEPLRATYTLGADSLKVADLFPAKSGQDRQEVRQLKIAGRAEGALSAPEVSADLSSSQGEMANIPYRNFAMAAGYGGKRLTVRSLKLDAYGGSLAAKGEVKLAAVPRFEVSTEVQNLDLEQALRAQKSKAADTVRGRLTGTVSVGGSGADFKQIKPSLNGQGRVALRAGRLVGINVVAQALRKISGIPQLGSLVSPALMDRHPELFKNPDTDLKSASLSFRLQGPRISSRDIDVESTDYTIDGQGWFDMDNNVDLATQLMLSREFSSELRAEKKNVAYLMDKQGQVTIPLVIKGTLPKPAVVPDVQALVQRAATHAVEKHGEQLLERLIHKRGGAGTAPIPGAAPTPAPLLPGPLRNLFR